MPIPMLIAKTKITYAMNDMSEFNPYMWLYDFPKGLPENLTGHVKFAQFNSVCGWEVIGESEDRTLFQLKYDPRISAQWIPFAG